MGYYYSDTEVYNMVMWITTKANGKYNSSIPQNMTPLMSITGYRLYSYSQIVLKVYSKMPPIFHTTFFVYHCDNNPNIGFLG